MANSDELRHDQPMAGALLVARASMRRQWRGLVVVALLIGFGGAVVLATAAGARRTSTSLERFREFSRAGDVEIDLNSATAAQIDELRRDPSVAGVGLLRMVVLASPSGGILPSAASVDGTFGTEVDRARVIKGRLARPTSVTELAVSESFAEQYNLAIGDRVSFPSFTPEQTTLASTGAEVGDPAGPTVRFRIVGLVRLPLDLGVLGAFGGIAVPTPAFAERYDGEIGGFVPALLRVRLADDARVADVVQAARRIFGDSVFQVLSVSVETEGARDAIGVWTAALWIFAGVAALAAITAIGLITLRQVGSEERDQETLASLGLTVRQRALASLAVMVPAAIAGSVLAVVGAVLASPVFPMGIARRAEVNPGVHVDALVLGLGFAAVATFVLLVAAASAWRVARTFHRNRATDGVTRPSAAARIAERAGATPTFTTGFRMALEPGRGATAVPVRTAYLGAVLGTLGIVAVLVFGASLAYLVATPRLFGWTWDAVVVPTVEQPRPRSEVCGDVETSITRDRALAAVASICKVSMEIEGHPVIGWGITPLRGAIEPALIAGRLPSGPQEIALGATTLDIIGKRVGDTTRARGPIDTGTYRIVGQVALPSLGPDDVEPLSDGAWLTGKGLYRISGEESAPNMSFVVDIRDDIDVSALPVGTSGTTKLDTGLASLPIVPVEVDRLRQVNRIPSLLGLLLAILATAAVAHTVWLSVRRRRRDLAVLRTVGFRRRDVRATIAYECTTIAFVGLVVGVPAGFVVGRAVWDSVAGGLGLSSAVRLPVIGVALLAFGALAVVNAIGLIAAQAALRDRPAAALAAE